LLPSFHSTNRVLLFFSHTLFIKLDWSNENIVFSQSCTCTTYWTRHVKHKATTSGQRATRPKMYSVYVLLNNPFISIGKTSHMLHTPLLAKQCAVSLLALP
jgi:hypothetical protein